MTQLFDLSTDPQEKHDLAGDPARRQKALGDTAPLAVANPRPARVDLDFFNTSR